MIHVIATIEVVDGQLNNFLTAFRALTHTVRDEDGCIEYGPAVDLATEIPGLAPARANMVTVIEKWTSPAALAAHLKAPHMATYREKAKHMIAGVSIQVLAPA
jgi:quinol monooxygenase YgiN